MGDCDDLNENLCLLDVFRVTVRHNEISDIEHRLRESENVANQSARQKGLQVACLDLSATLAEKKIVEDNDDKPWTKLQQILFDRLMIEDYTSCNAKTLNFNSNSRVLSFPNFEKNSYGNEFNPCDHQILRYLYGCYFRLQESLKVINATKDNKSVIKDYDRLSATLQRAESMIFDQVALYLTEPELFPDRDKRHKNNQQAPLLLNLISHYHSRRDLAHIEVMQKFVNSIGDSCKSLGDPAYESIIVPTYSRLSQKFVSLAIDDPSVQEWFGIVRVFTQQPDIARKFVEKNCLKNDNSISYQSTLLGFMLCVSPLPKTSQFETTFFNDIRLGQSDHKFTETQLGVKLEMVGKELYTIFHTLLKSAQTRNLFLSWMGRCLHTFKDRKKLWNNQVLMATTTLSVNDGFLMNFLTVLLHLSEPFAGPYILDKTIGISMGSLSIDKKMLKVDPKYCKWSRATHDNSLVHFLGLLEETFLINRDRSSTNNMDNNQDYQPNFISECFYGTHQAFTYGFKSIYERFFKLAQNINEVQHTLASAASNPLPSSMSNIDPIEQLKERLNGLMTQFFNLKAVLMVPNRVAMQIHFCIATAAYLNHLVACQSYEEAMSATEFKVITLKALKEKQVSKACLEYIPEMLVENVLDFFIFLKNFNDQALARASTILEPLMTLIITFMGNSSLMQNPHLRARFAEILECLMPHQSQNYGQHFFGCAELFENHPLIEELAPSLVNVFVGIEMTGEGVQFEQKFSYRRPMYVVLEFLWSRPLHRRMLVQLAQEAERDIESARPPIFLRFINLLMNDAIFLLDEALGFMNQLKEAERRRKSEEWLKLTPQQRSQAESTYTHIGRMARFHNVLSMFTIGTLAWLTKEIKTIFCHPSLVDRIANMLNYFLEHLVGSKRSKFNVEDKNDYEFKPKEILEKICQIYINLGQRDCNQKFKEFCSAVSSDGRSYSETLLPQATDILFRTGMSSLGTEFEKLSKLIHEVAVRNQMDEINSEDIPDTFLDPIMSTLMVDPVLLPSSRIVVDRSTIARHLLSDQTDPFNRSPLSMEDVIPETDLKNQIECFLRERREAQQQHSGNTGEGNK